MREAERPGRLPDEEPIWRRIRRMFGPDVAADVDEEIEFHLEMATDELVASGMSPDEARREAERRFGDRRAVARQCRVEGGRRVKTAARREWLRGVGQDLAYGLRQLRRDPGFAVAALLTLALAIGAVTAVASVVDGVLLAPLPFEEPDEIVRLWPGGSSSRAEYVRVAQEGESYDRVAAYSVEVGFTVDTAETQEGEPPAPERLRGVYVTAGLLDVLGLEPAVGTGFEADDGPVGIHGARPGQVAISHRLWQRRFGGDPEVVGRRIRVDGEPHTVVAVLPRGLSFPDRDVDVWGTESLTDRNLGEFWGSSILFTVARLADGATPGTARAELRNLAAGLQADNPIWTPSEGYVEAAGVAPLKEALVGSTRPAFLILVGGVLLVLLVAVANVANLLLARAASRERELAVRSFMGAGRGRLVRQLLTESLAVAVLGGALGLVLAVVGVEALVALLPADLPRVDEVGIDGRVLAFSVVLTVVTTLLFGLLPALRTTGRDRGRRSVGLGALGGATTQGRSQRRLAGLLVAAEVALAVVLLVGAGLLGKSFAALQSVAPGFETTRVMTAEVGPPAMEYARDDARIAFYGELVERVGAIPGVEAAGLASQVPFDQGAEVMATGVEGKTPDPNALPLFDSRRIVPGTLEALGVPLLAGRRFTEADRADSLPVALVDQAAVDRFWPDEDPLGQRIRYPWGGEDAWMTVVGVVGEIKNNQLAGDTRPAFYVPYSQRTQNTMNLVVRSGVDPEVIVNEVRRAVESIDPDVALGPQRTLDELVDDSLGRLRFTSLLLALFAAVALGLGAVGIYGIVSYGVGRRTREIGVRMAVGAGRGEVFWEVMRGGLGQVLLGVVAGVAGAVALGRVLAGLPGELLYGVETTDPWLLVGVPAALVLVAVVASWLPARRAVAIDPVSALRAD